MAEDFVKQLFDFVNASVDHHLEWMMILELSEARRKGKMVDLGELVIRSGAYQSIKSVY